jgi:hypothetical protein
MPLHKSNMGIYNDLAEMRKPSSPPKKISSSQREPQAEPATTTKQPSPDSLAKEEREVKLASSQASKLSSLLANYPDSMIEMIRKSVKTTGKEVSFVRLTLEEKKQLADIVYTLKSQKIKTTENEINRIAINFLLEDYRLNGENSVLARVLAALLA